MSVYDLKHLKASSAAFSKVKAGSWSHMMKNDVATSKIKTIVEQGMMLSVGRGESILFWHDKWCDLGPLKAAFPRLFSISIQKNQFITHMGSWQGETWSWNLRWRRNVYDWEQEDIQRLSQGIGHIQPNTESADGVLWRASGNSSFQVKCISDMLYESSPPLISKQAVASIWQSHIPPRAQLTVWLAHLEKLKTGDILMEKGIIPPHQALCPLCNIEVESNSHVLFTCPFSWGIWMDLLSWWGIRGVLHSKCQNFCVEWDGLLVGRKRKSLWKLILACTIWSLWYTRNKAKFELIPPDHGKVSLSLKFRIMMWAKELLIQHARATVRRYEDLLLL